MTIPVQVEFGNHVLNTQMHALPSVGDRVTCNFPTSGVPTLVLQVSRVHFHQPPGEFEGRACPEPFGIVVTTEDDPEFAAKNKAVLAALTK